MPLLHSRVGKQTYAYLVDKVHSRLASWKCKILNMAGRLTLIHSVNAAIPIYAMQTAKLPISICDSLDKLNRDFLWGDFPDSRKIHAVNWASVCRPKSFGGLGIKRTRDMNNAMLAKAGWRMVQGDDGLWCQLFSRKYLSQSSLLQNYKLPASCSSTWSSIVHGFEMLKKGLRWRIGDGTNVKFWEDHWTDFGRLGSLVAGEADINLSEKVCDFWLNGEWNREKLNFFLPKEITDSICAIPFAKSTMEDRLIWNATPDGKFSVKTAYLLRFAEDDFAPYPWAKNWKLNVPPKLKIFLWSVVAGKLMTNHQRMCRKFTNDSSCFQCPGVPETLLHLLRDCPKAKMVWDAFDVPEGLLPSFVLNCQGWLSSNLHWKNCVLGNIPWNILFSCCCWHLWKWRCRCVFDCSFNLPYNAKQIILDFVEEWLLASKKSKVKIAGSEVMLSWTRPPAGFFKINVDGSRNSKGGIGAGGVLRDCEGRWCRGFMINLGMGEVLQAEAWGLYHGLQLALQHGVSKVLCESDSAVLINLMLDSDVGVHPLGTIIKSCRSLMQEFSSCSLNHVHRERNFVADGLAKASLNLEKGMCIVEKVPLCVAAAMEEDGKGVARMRRLPAHTVQVFDGADTDVCRLSGDATDLEPVVQRVSGYGLAVGIEEGDWSGSGYAAAWGRRGISKADGGDCLNPEKYAGAVADAEGEGKFVKDIEAGCAMRDQPKDFDAVANCAGQDMEEAGVVPGRYAETEACCASAVPVACNARHPCKAHFSVGLCFSKDAG